MDSYDLGWLVGFIEGEGCFHISFDHHRTMKRDADPRRDWLVRPIFHVCQTEEAPIRRLEALLSAEDISGGVVAIPAKGKNSSQWKFVTYNLQSSLRLASLLETAVWHSKKRADFEKWTQAIRMIGHKEHRYKDGFLAIAKLATDMNHTGRPPRRLNYEYFVKLWEGYEWRAIGGTPPRERLMDLYEVQQLSLDGVGRIYRVSRGTVAKWLRHHGIQPHPSGGAFQRGRKKKPHSEATKAHLSSVRRRLLDSGQLVRRNGAWRKVPGS